MFKLILSKEIEDDIASSMSYIADTLNAPMAARKHLEELRNKYARLEGNPFIRPLVHDKFLASKGFRSIMVKNYMLLYKVDEENNTVYLHKFMHSKRDWINILTNEL